VIKGILACLLFVAVPAGWSQSTVSDKTEGSAIRPALPPYDRLELLASIAVGGSDSYLVTKVRERGIDFTADLPFLGTISRWNAHTDLVLLIENARPVAKHTPSPDRQKAYALMVPLSTKMKDATATAVFQSAVALAPESPALHLAFAAHLFWVDPASAEGEARKSIELWPDDAAAHSMLAMILIKLDRTDEGELEARHALSIYPQYAAVVAELGLAMWRDRQFKEAIPVLRQAISQNVRMPFLHKYLGISLFNTGDIEGAINEYVTFLQTSPSDADGHYQLGIAFRAEGHADDALAQFKECARLNPSFVLCAAAADPSSASKGFTPSVGYSPDNGVVDRNIYTNRFFGFSFQFPENWTPLTVEAARAAAKLGAGMLSGGDPTFEDAQQAGAAHAYPLLFVVPPKDQGISSRGIQIQALDSQITGPDIASGKEFLESAARLYRRMHTPLQPTGPPTEVSTDDRKLWRLDMTMNVDNNLHYFSEIVTIQDGFLLLFTFTSPDQTGLDDLLRCMNSLHFLPKSN
jgi:tetratricopeptide (TPR) repeat protein